MPSYTPRRKLIEKIKQQQLRREKLKITIDNLKHSFKNSRPTEILKKSTLLKGKKPETGVSIQAKTPKSKDQTASYTHKTQPETQARKTGKQSFAEYVNRLIMFLLELHKRIAPQIKVALKHLTLFISLPYHRADGLAKTIFHKISIILLFPSLFWSGRWYILTVVNILFITINLNAALDKKISKIQFPEIQMLNNFPSLPYSWTQLSRVYFEKNQEDLSRKALSQAKTYRQILDPLNISPIKKDIAQAESLLALPQKRRSQIASLKNLLVKYPYSWQLLATKALYEKELYLEQEEGQSTTQIQWLYPNYTHQNSM